MKISLKEAIAPYRNQIENIGIKFFDGISLLGFMLILYLVFPSQVNMAKGIRTLLNMPDLKAGPMLQSWLGVYLIGILILFVASCYFKENTTLAKCLIFIAIFNWIIVLGVRFITL